MSWADMTPALLDQRQDPGVPLDPYLLWALITGFAGTLLGGAAPAQARVPLLAELSDAAAMDAGLRAEFAAQYGLAAIYQSALNGAGDLGRFVSLSVPAAALQGLLMGGQVKRAELGVCRLAGWPARPAPTPQNLLRSADAGKGAADASLVLGVIDDGYAFLQRRLLPHMAYLWDQNLPGSAHAALGYGTELGPAEFALLRQQYGADGDDEDAGYRALGLGWNGMYSMLRRSHGTAMLSAALGLEPPLDEWAAGMPALPCVAVQLPEATLADTSGGAFGIGVLDGLRYVLERARRLGNADTKVLVNISLGTQAGPHDGTSLLERAMAELVDLHPGLCLMLAAGNCRLDQGHAVLRMAAGAAATVRLRVPSDSTRHGFVEFWLPPQLPLDTLTVRVQMADGEVFEVGVGQYRADARQRAQLIFPRRCALSETGAMVLLAIAPTGSGGDGAAPAGEWRVTLQHPGPDLWECHAYIHRDDQIYGRRRPQGLRFLDADDAVVQQEGTLSGIATVQAQGPQRWASLNVIGAYQASDGRVSAYSSLGGTRGDRHGPDMLLAADLGAYTQGRACLGTHSNTWQRAGGSSLAAAMASARQLALLPRTHGSTYGDKALAAVAATDELVASERWPSRVSLQEGGKRVLD